MTRDVKSWKHANSMVSFEKTRWWCVKGKHFRKMWKIFATYRFCSQRMIVMLRAENSCPIVFHFFCGESKRVKGVLKNEQIKSCWENVQVVSAPFDFCKWRFNSRHIYFNELIVGARASALSSSTAISMPPVPVVAMFAVWAFVHPNVISFIAPWVGSDSSLESVFGAGQANCLLFWIIIFWIHGVRSWIFVTQLFRAFFHASIPCLCRIFVLATGDAIVSCVALVRSIKAHGFLCLAFAWSCEFLQGLK